MSFCRYFLQSVSQQMNIAKQRTLPYLAIAIFIIAKIPHLHYGFYWDESWVYGPAIYAMYAHGPSLSPAAISIDLSRGHPLLYHACCAAWMQLFGPSLFSVHCYALFVSVLLAVAVYEYMRRLFGHETGLLALLLLLCNSDFFYTSSMLLTDIPLCLFVFAGIYAYSRRHYASASIAVTVTAYIKESGLVLLPVIGADILAGFLTKKISLRELVRSATVVLIPAVAIFIFFAVQKKVNGWYMNPDHIAIIHTGILYTASFIQRSMKLFLLNNYEYVYFMLAVIISIAAVVQTRRYSYLYMPAAIVILFIATLVLSYKDVAFFVLMPAAMIIGVLLLKKAKRFTDEQFKFMRVTTLFCIGYVYFCCINFFEERYLFPAFMLTDICVLAIYLVYTIQAFPRKKLVYIATLLLCATTGIYSIVNDAGNKCTYNRMDVQQDVTDYFEHMHNYSVPVCAREFFEYIHLTDPGTGFLRYKRAFTHVRHAVDSSTQYVIITSEEYNDGWLPKLEANDRFYPVQTFKREGETITILKRR